MTRENSSLERAGNALRAFLQSNPGAERKDVMTHVTKIADVHHSTVTRAICDATGLGLLQHAGTTRCMRYFWSDSPIAIATDDRNVRTIPAALAPKVAAAVIFPNGIAWGLYHCLRRSA